MKKELFAAGSLVAQKKDTFDSAFVESIAALIVGGKVSTNSDDIKAHPFLARRFAAMEISLKELHIQKALKKLPKNLKITAAH